jgi:hypothetical protein
MIKHPAKLSKMDIEKEITKMKECFETFFKDSEETHDFISPSGFEIFCNLIFKRSERLCF